jgi:ketosteroid isomerase-like protein
MRCSGVAVPVIFISIWMSSCSETSSNAEQELRTAMEQRRAAFDRGDAESYTKLTADNLVVIDDQGAYRTKASVLEQIRRQGPERSPGKVSDVHVSINGDIGILAYQVDLAEKLGNQSFKSENRELETFQRQSGKWILVSRAIIHLPNPNRTPAKIDTAVYSNYVGVYDFGDNVQFTVKKEGDKLLMFDEAKTPQNLLPLSESNFYLDKSSGVFVFVRDKKGKVVAIEIWDGNSTIRGEKIS